MTKLTYKDIEEAIKNVRNSKPTCSGEHNMEHSGHCHICNVIWIGKEDRKNVMELFNEQTKQI